MITILYKTSKYYSKQGSARYTTGTVICHGHFPTSHSLLDHDAKLE
jgi:hypothetical protein